MSTQHNTPPALNGQPPTRREVLKGLALVPLLAAPLAIFPDVGKIEYAPTIPPPYGPQARTEVIDRWIGRVDEALITLEKYYTFLIKARGLSPEAVDGVKLVNMENEVHAICDGMSGYIDCDYENCLISNATGRAASAVCIEAELINHYHDTDERFNRDFWQREVDACGRDHPEELARLQAALNTCFGGAI